MCPEYMPKDHPCDPSAGWSIRHSSRLWGLFSDIYSHTGRPSIAEQLFRALVLQVLYTIRSERLLMEQLDYNLLFRWFVEMRLDEPGWTSRSSRGCASGW